MRVVILCPRREGFADRDALWQWCRPWWYQRFPDWPVVEGHHVHGLFNRSAAINTAAQLAGEWDVAVVIDSDVLAGTDNVRQAVQMAHEQGQMTVPFHQRNDLNETGTRKVQEGYAGSWEPYVRRRYQDQHSSVIAIPRRLYDAIGGFDEGFAGWGLEDTAFAMACEVFAGQKLLRVPGEVWHLYHKPAPEKHGSIPHARNVARANRWRAAWSQEDREAMRALVEDGRQLEANRQADSIPRILHRVVPEQTPAQAEQWWQAFGRMHPTWRLMTHRDPLDPADWPLTSPHWRKVRGGAQLADLVRLEALLRWGGVYVDMDVQPFRSLDPLLGVEAFAAWEDDQTVPNAVLGARPEHPAIRACLQMALQVMRRGVWAAGPGVTTKLLPGRDDVLLLPPGSFYDVHYRDDDRDAKMAGPASPWSFVRHHYWGSWLEPERQRVPA